MKNYEPGRPTIGMASAVLLALSTFCEQLPLRA